MARSSEKRISVKAPAPSEYTKAWRKFLKELLITRIRTKKEREELAEKMGVSEHYIKAMLYKNEGGIDAWACAVTFAYGIKYDDLSHHFASIKSALMKMEAPSKADQVWNQLDQIVNESEKFHWISLLHALIVADKK